MSTARIRQFLAALLLMGACGGAAAGGITEHGIYVYLDTQAREITLQGMDKRLKALSSGATSDELQRLDGTTRQRIEKLFADWNVTPASHAAYGGRNREAIEAWIKSNPSWARTYDRLQSQFEALSAKLSATR